MADELGLEEVQENDIAQLDELHYHPLGRAVDARHVVPLALHDSHLSREEYVAAQSILTQH